MEEQAGNGTLQFQIRHTMSELCVAMFVAWIRKPCVWVLPVVVSCSLRNVLGWPLAVTIAMLLFFGVPYLGARITVRASGGRAGIFYGFSSEGFSAKSDLAATTFPWQAVRGARETGGFMFIEFQGWAVTIPVRQITGDQAEQLGGLLRIHVLKNVKLAKR